ncbi:AB24G protein, partial [Oreocharis arfaki]|nr:AB24G protein [Oreocharis arfaki]
NPRDGESGLPCPAGHYCPQGAPVPLQCPPGTWSGREGRRNVQECQPCPGGHFCNGSGQRAPSGQCSPGFYCASGAQTPTPTDGLSGAPCPVGHFCPRGSRSPVPCPPGSHVPHSHGEQCQACLEGRYCVSGEEPAPCPRGELKSHRTA